MTKRILGMIVTITLMVSGVRGTNPESQRRGRNAGENFEAAEHGWLGSLDEGKAEARHSGLPMMVVIRCVP